MFEPNLNIVDARFEINLPQLLRAIEFYKKLGYKPISAAQCVGIQAINKTIPEGAVPLAHDEDNFYVGSAEQSFYDMMTRYKIRGTPISPNGKFMLLTPCQRNEHVIDDSHLEIFLKLELISFERTVVTDALAFFRQEGLKDAIVVDTPQGLDIEYKGVELGSYGKRTHEGEIVYFGTGIAMPRISYAIAKAVNLI
ncbi:histidyl tRNA synthetase [Acinetobacter phage vB_AbaM_PhT2-v2]